MSMITWLMWFDRVRHWMQGSPKTEADLLLNDYDELRRTNPEAGWELRTLAARIRMEQGCSFEDAAAAYGKTAALAAREQLQSKRPSGTGSC